jgi:tetratricopeptide (TPR) repeat protein
MPTIPPDGPDRTTPAPGGSTLAPPSGSGTLVGTHDAPPAAPTPALPDIPGYEVVGEIARGGMGLVLAAREPALDREVALKVLLPGADPVAAARRFVTEARITARLPHPGIPPVYALGELPDGGPFLAMKLIRGRTLSELLRERPDPSADLPRFVGIFEQVCQAVAYAHSQGVVHRDLKPSNVMVGSFGEVQVMDWGLARSGVRGQESGVSEDSPACGSATRNGSRTVPGDEDATVDGAVLGTPAYIAPEQARGERVDERADVFALGGVLCAVLTGQPPFPADTRVALGLSAAGDVSAALGRLAACPADPELVVLARRCLNPERSDRPADAAAVAAEVAAYRAGVEERLRHAEAGRAAAAAEAREQRKRRTVQLALAAAVGLLVAGGVAFAWWQDHQAAARRAEQAAFEREREIAERQTRTRVPELVRLAADLRAQAKFADAARALGQAAGLAEAGAADLLPAVERARADLAFVRQLDEIRYRKWLWVTEGGRGRFDRAGAPPAYRAAFAARGFDFAEPIDDVAARLAASEVKAELVAALDDWAVHEPDRVLAGRLLAVARRADPGPWGDRFRDPAVRRDAVRLWWLARAADPDALASATLAALAELMEAAGLDPTGPLLAAQRRHPTDFSLSFALGHWYFKRDLARSLGHFRAARAVRPDNPSAMNNLADLLRRSGDARGALDMYEEAIRLNPDNAQLRSNLGGLFRDLRRTDAAVAMLREAVRIDPGYVPARNNLGAALHDRGNLDAAVGELREAVRLDPAYAPGWANLAAVYRDKGDRAAALPAARRAVELDPGSGHAHNELGNLLLDTGRVPDAITALAEAVRLDPGVALHHNNLGNAILAAGDTDGAIAELRAAVRLDPGLAVAHNNLGKALRARGDVDGALAAYREAIRLDPRFAMAHYNLGNALLARRDVGAAEAAFREAVRIDPGYARAHSNLGLVLQQRGDLAGALAAYAEAARLDPKDRIPPFNRGLVFGTRGELDAAEAAFREALRLDPGWKEAERYLQQVLRLKAERDGRIAPPPREVRR